MKKKITKLTLLLIVILSSSVVLFGCAINETTPQITTTQGDQSDDQTEPADTDETTTADVVQLPFLYRHSGNDSGMQMNQYYVDGFNEMYEGQYEIEVEWMPGVAVDIRAKLKMLNASSELPALVTDLGAEPAFADLLIRNNRLVDLKPYFDASPEWQEVCIPESVEFNTSDGKMYTSPAVAESYVGVFYNMEYFEQAGIDEFPKTWDDFWDACEKLEAEGITPISLHTTETGWCPMLMGTSNMANSEAGRNFMKQRYPTNFNDSAFIETMEIIKRLFDYSTSDAVGGNYALAANNFCAGMTAMIPNGPWMIPSLSDTQFSPEGFDEIVGYAHFPEGVMLSNQGEAYGFGVSVDHSVEVQEGTVEYLKFMARPESIRETGVVMGNLSSIVALTDDDLAKLSPPMQEYAKAVNSLEKTMVIYQGRWDPITQNEVIPAELPSLITGQITVDEFCEKMITGAERYDEDSN